MTTRAAQRTAFAVIVDPPDNDVIFRERGFAPDVDGVLSRYGDMTWRLRPLAQKATARPLDINFDTLPAAHRAVAKRVIWQFINRRTPGDELERPTALRGFLAAGTIESCFHDLRLFLSWLDQRGIHTLGNVGPEDFRAYAELVTRRNVVRGVKGRLLFTVTRAWLVAPFLPERDRLARPTWESPGADTDSLDAVLGPANWNAENKTSPIHPQTMSALLVAATTMVNTLGEDILRARAERDRIRSAVLPQPKNGQHQTVLAYLHTARQEGRAIPGAWRQGKAVVAKEFLAGTLAVSYEAIRTVTLSGLPVDVGAPLPTRVHGRIDDTPWCSAIDYYDVDRLMRMLMIASFIVTAYLSGMRVEECRALERGCCVPVAAHQNTPPHYEVRGRSFKDALDRNGDSIPGGREREAPWLVLEPVAAAVNLAERLHHGPHLFPASAFTSSRSSTTRPASAAAIRTGVRDFIEWWNDFAAHHDVIPPDPEGEITPAQFRRTLAWFIYRVPGGRIALGLQYGHLRGYTSDGYGSRVASGLRDVFPMEEALAVADSLQSAAERLEAGESVSGPAAARFAYGAREYRHTFDGTYLSTRQMAALRRNPDLRIYDSPDRALACVYDQAKAQCHQDRDRRTDDSSRTPDMTRCRESCGNIARTDSHIEVISHQIEELTSEIASPLTPEPIRERLRLGIERRQHIVDTHEREKERQ